MESFKKILRFLKRPLLIGAGVLAIILVLYFIPFKFGNYIPSLESVTKSYEGWKWYRSIILGIIFSTLLLLILPLIVLGMARRNGGASSKKKAPEPPQAPQTSPSTPATTVTPVAVVTKKKEEKAKIPTFLRYTFFFLEVAVCSFIVIIILLKVYLKVDGYSEPLTPPQVTIGAGKVDPIPNNCLLPVDEDNRQYVEQFFKKRYADKPEVAAEFVRIAERESNYNQLRPDGTVFRRCPTPENTNTHKVGILQIDEDSWRKKARSLGYDIDTLDGNLEFGAWLRDKEGFKPWATRDEVFSARTSVRPGTDEDYLRPGTKKTITATPQEVVVVVVNGKARYDNDGPVEVTVVTPTGSSTFTDRAQGGEYHPIPKSIISLAFKGIGSSTNVTVTGLP